MYYFQYLGRSLSTGLGAESDRGYDSYRAGTCSVHGTLKRHVSSGIDTTMEEDVFDDFSGCDTKPNGGPAFPFPTADMMLKTGAGRSRSRAGSLSSPTHVVAPPRLGVSGLYTDHMERRKYSIPASNSLSPPVRIYSLHHDPAHNIFISDDSFTPSSCKYFNFEQETSFPCREGKIFKLSKVVLRSLLTTFWLCARMISLYFTTRTKWCSIAK